MNKQKIECTLKMISLSFTYSIQIHEIEWWWQSLSQLISKADDCYHLTQAHCHVWQLILQQINVKHLLLTFKQEEVTNS